jgi:acyl dehydratase
MFFDDFRVGDRFETGARQLSEAEIIAFARQNDPQPFHTDPEAARATPYGGLIASGLQTMAVALVQVIEAGIWAESSLGSPGLDEIRWLVPVRPGDTLCTRCEVLELAPSGSRPDRGRVLFLYETLNQRDEVVMRYRAIQMLRRRAGG